MIRTDILDVPQVPENVAVAIFVALITAVCALGASAWQMRYPLPVTYARAAEPLATKAQESVEPSPLPVYQRPTTAYSRLDPPVKKTETRAAKLPWTCAEIRAFRETHTDAEMRAKADEARLTLEQREIAKGCLKGKRS